MTGICKSCGTGTNMVVPFTCDLTGMRYDSAISNCGCKKENKYSHLPERLQKKIKELDNLEKACTALGIHDKISSARFVLNSEIEAFEKSKKIV